MSQEKKKEETWTKFYVLLSLSNI
jgi:hypothetical protein